MSKRQYKYFTGKDEKNDVLVYQVRKSFKPGEVTPKETNKSDMISSHAFSKENTLSLFVLILTKPISTITSIGMPPHLIANGSSAGERGNKQREGAS